MVPRAGSEWASVRVTPTAEQSCVVVVNSKQEGFSVNGAVTSEHSGGVLPHKAVFHVAEVNPKMTLSRSLPCVLNTHEELASPDQDLPGR